MKFFIITLGIISVAFIISCDQSTEPYGPVGDRGWSSGFDQTHVFNDTLTTKRRILFEEFTGHKCPNCPEGADIATQIHSDHPEDFLVVSIHNSGSFSKPDSHDPDHPYPSNFETETGENLRIKYQFSSFPGGMLNRSDINGTVKINDKYQWANEVNALVTDAAYMEPRFKLYIESIFNNELGNKSVRINYKVKALKGLIGNFALAAYVLESHIIAPQIDKRLSNPYVHDYEHNHVLRVGFPGNGDGKTLFVNPAKGDVTESVTDADLLFSSLEDNWVSENIDIVVFMYNSDTGEIMAVEEMKLMN